MKERAEELMPRSGSSGERLMVFGTMLGAACIGVLVFLQIYNGHAIATNLISSIVTAVFAALFCVLRGGCSLDQ